MLTVLRTHHPPELLQPQLSYLTAVAPGSRFVVCHGGKRADFERLEWPEAIFIEDPSLRGPDQFQSWTETLGSIYSAYVRDDPSVDLVYILEYDHLIVRGDFEDSLRAIAARSPAGLFGKHANRRNDSNFPHFVRFRRDAELREFIRRISQRDDADSIWGCLGTGMLMRREFLEAFCLLEGKPDRYLEMLVPTVAYHLGFDVDDFDEFGDLYAAVRWRPEYSLDEAIREKRAGRTFVHPFKELDQLDALLRTEAPPARPDTGASAPRSTPRGAPAA